MTPLGEQQTVEVSNYQQFTQFKYTDAYRPTVYLLLCGEMTPEQVEIFKHPDIIIKVVEIFTRDIYDVSSHLLATYTRGLAIALAMALQAENALVHDNKDRAMQLLEAADWLSETFTAIGDVPFINDDGTVPYTDSYRKEAWMQEIPRTGRVE